MNNGTILTGNGLTKKYGDLEVVKEVSLSIAGGEFVCLVGKSGCGKTTLLSLLSGLERPTAGKVMLDGKDITSATEDELALFRRDNVGFIFQSFNLIPTLSAWENVALPLFPIKMPAEERERRAMELLEKMELVTPGGAFALGPFRGRETAGGHRPGPRSTTPRSFLPMSRPETWTRRPAMPSWRS